MGPTIVTCPCGARVELPESAGPDAPTRCPDCGAELARPAPPTAPATKDCPFCGEAILAAARKCKHCGEFLDEAAVPASKRHAPAPAPAPTSEPNGAEYFTAVVLAPVGLLIGLIWAALRRPKAGRMIAVSAAMCVIDGVAAYLIWTYALAEDNDGPAVAAGALNNPPQRVFVVPGGDEDDAPPAPPRRSALAGGEVDLEGQPPIVQKALKANVRIETDGGAGSGVVLARDGDRALILTNHHVVDMAFARSSGSRETPLKDMSRPKVSYFNGQSNPAEVTWYAPDGIDLALVRAVAPAEVEPASWHAMPRVAAGQEVFAVGNPVGLDWSYTKGVVSALRRERFPRDEPRRDVPIIQTDAGLNPGNSGGGLYAADGELVGINSSIVDPSRGSRLGFAIRTTVLLDLKPPGLDLPEGEAGR